MNNDTLSLHEHISLEAFLLSEQAGHPVGMDKTFWTQAEAIVHGRAAVVAGAGKAAPKSKAKPKAAKPAAAKPSSSPAKAEATTKAKPKATGKRAR